MFSVKIRSAADLDEKKKQFSFLFFFEKREKLGDFFTRMCFFLVKIKFQRRADPTPLLLLFTRSPIRSRTRLQNTDLIFLLVH